MSLLLLLKNDLINVVNISVNTTDGSDFTQASVTPVAVSASASGMSRRFWQEYYTKAWAKPVLVTAEIALPATMTKKSVVAVVESVVKASASAADSKRAMHAQADAFISGLLQENAINIAMELAAIESVAIKSFDYLEDEELLLMAMVI